MKFNIHDRVIIDDLLSPHALEIWHVKSIDGDIVKLYHPLKPGQIIFAKTYQIQFADELPPSMRIDP